MKMNAFQKFVAIVWGAYILLGVTLSQSENNPPAWPQDNPAFMILYVIPTFLAAGLIWVFSSNRR
jgi:hypothetical protein